MLEASVESRALAPLSLPTLHEARLANGLTVVSAARSRLPLVSVCLVWNAGSAQEPKGKAGLADFSVELLRRGTERRRAEQIDEALEMMGADLRVATSADSTYVSATAPSEHLRPLISLIAELIQEPAFAPTEVRQAKKRLAARLLTDLDDPAIVAADALYRVALGRHPYAHPGRGIASHVASFTRADCLGFHRKACRPSEAHLIVVGDVDPEEACELCSQRFGRWRGAAGPLPPIPPVPEIEGQRILLVNKPEASQAQVRIASLGPGKLHPRLVAARVAAQVLGGGFASRLVNAIRVNRGLSYGISSMLTETEAGGLFLVSSFTKNETLRELVEVSLEEVRRFREGGPAEEELARTKRYMNGTFPLALETGDQLAHHLADMKRFGRDPDWLQHYRDRVREASVEEVTELARRYFLAKGWALAVVGDARALAPQLKPFSKEIEVLSSAKRLV